MIQNRSLSMSIYQPLSVGSDLISDDLGDKISSYSHEILANGGFWTAQMSVNSNQKDAENWLLNWLGCRVVVRGAGLNTVWEGFIDTISTSIGGISVTRGPVLDVSNKVQVVYQTVQYNTNPPVGGDRAETAFSSDTDSQGVYGILEDVVSAGTCNSTEATQIRDVYLEERKDPNTSEQLSIGRSSNSVTVSFKMKGYVHYLDRYYYSQTATSEEINLSVKLKAVLTADPNSFFDNQSNIDTNTSKVGSYENDQKSAWAIIKSLVARGDANDNRYIFGIYENREVYYNAIPTDFRYRHRIGDPEQRVELVGGGRVYPWDVRPGYWIQVPDFMIGTIETSDIKENKRAIFIESIKFTLPWGLEIKSGNTDRLTQVLAKKGLGGV